MNNKSTAPVSAIVPCWRSGSTIQRALASIAAQTLRPAEVLLVDDASGDNTLATLHALALQYPPGWIKVIGLEQNLGPGGARNAGWDHSTQPWLAFLDADDAWHPRKIEMQYNWLLSQTDVALCGHGTVVAAGEEQYPVVSVDPRTWRVGFWKMLVSCRFPTRSVMLKRELPLRFEGKQVTEDYLLWLQVLQSGYKCYRMDAPLAVSFRPDFSPGGYSGQLWKHEKRELAAWRALRKQRLIGRITLAAAASWSLIKYVRRVAVASLDFQRK
jgi:teichuronic acid biosynthesis glycosyltransferase TuaG